MDDQLDNELRDRIKEVFEDFEDHSADEGWLLLRTKFPEERSNRRPFAWIWWGAAAAILFLFLGIGLWVINKNDNAEKISAKKTTDTHTKNLASVKKHDDTIIKTIPPSAESHHTERLVKPDDNFAATPVNKKTSPAIVKNLPVNIKPGLIVVDTTEKRNFIARKNDSAKKIIGQLQQNQQAVVKPQSKLVKGDSTHKSNLPDNQVVAANKPDNTIANPDIAKPKVPGKSIETMLADNNSKKVKPMGEKSARVHFGVFAATYFNYAKGSNRQANIGAGATADITITKNLKLETGVTIAQNSLNFTGGVPTTDARASFALANAPSAYTAISNVTQASIPAFKNYDANLVGLDIPLNLKFEFNPQKSSTYILAGVSSGTFVNETYTYQYNYPALLSPSLQQVQDETSRKTFNGFYFAKTLNVAFGVGYPLGRNRIILEPFLKYPLQGLGSQNIRFGAGGVNLKFNLLSPRK